MYRLTYMMKGDRICYYCGKTISKKEMTLDHVYPRDFGGPSITDNLVPCCQSVIVIKTILHINNIKKYYWQDRMERQNN